MPRNGRFMVEKPTIRLIGNCLIRLGNAHVLLCSETCIATQPLRSRSFNAKNAKIDLFSKKETRSKITGKSFVPRVEITEKYSFLRNCF